MSYPSVNFRPTTAPIGMQPITEVSTTLNHALGTVVRASDLNYGEGAFKYLAGVASTVAGDIVCYNSKSGATVRAVTGGSASLGSVAIAMAACDASTKYGWYQVSGSGPVNAAASVADSQVYLTSTAGQVDDAASADAVSGMVFKAATSAGFATVQFDGATVSTSGGSNTGDLTLGAVGAIANANGASLSGQVLTLQPSSTSFPGAMTAADKTKLDTLQSTALGYGTYASRTAAATAGRLYVASDAPVGLWVDTGAAWAPIIHGVVGTQPKAAASIATLFSKGGVTPTLTDRKGALHLSYAADGTATTIAGFVESLSSATAHLEASVALTVPRAGFVTSSYPGGGICMRESATGKIFAIQVVAYNATFTGAVIIEVSYWASTTSRTNVNAFNLPFLPLWLKLACVSTNIVAYAGTDNSNYATLQTTALTTAFTTAPNQVGICGQQNVGTDSVDMDVISYNSGS